MLDEATDGAVFLLNSPFAPGDVWDELPRTMQEELIRKHPALRHRRGPGGDRRGHARPDQHHHADVLLRNLRRAAARRGDRKIKDAIESTYACKGKELVESNFAAVDRTLENLHEVVLPPRRPARASQSPRARARARVRQAGDGHDDRGRGNELPVSAFLWMARTRPDGPMGEAEHLRQRPRLEARAVHPVRKLRDGVPARHDSRALLRRSMAGQRARRLRVRAPGRPRVSQPAHTLQVASRTAPGASSASRRALCEASRPRASAPSTWRRRRRFSSANEGTSRSSTRCPTTSRRGWTRSWCGALSI